MKNSLFIVALFFIGILIGHSGFIPEGVVNNNASMYVLYGLLFFVGITIGADKSALKVIKQVNYKIILIPLSIILGTFLGSYLVSFFLKDLSMLETVAVGAGFGYYSLSTIFLTEACGETLGVIALVSNITREIVTLLCTPFLIKYFGKTAGIAVGGATSMDTTLPIIVKYSGKEWGVISVFSGIVLTVFVPIIITFLIEMMAL